MWRYDMYVMNYHLTVLADNGMMGLLILSFYQTLILNFDHAALKVSGTVSTRVVSLG